MKKIKSLIIGSLIVVVSFSYANAWDYNYSWVEHEGADNVDRACGDNGELVKELSSVPHGSPQQGQCKDKNNNPIYFNTISVRTKISYPLINETCFRPTCYYRAANEGLFYRKPVQPLTNDIAAVRAVINGNMQKYYGEGVGTLHIGIWYNPASPDNHSPTNNGNNTIRQQLRLEYKAKQELYDQLTAKYGVPTNVQSQGNWEVSTGTSAMEGLLWSWRMLSNKWKGVWKTQSDYETSSAGANLRQNLPSSTNTKHIILISDGLDSDGPEAVTGVANGQVMTASDGSKGFVISNNNGASNKIFETCDANVPISSITDGDYAKTCEKLRLEGIKVHVILYGYDKNNPSNQRLEQCAKTTEGEFIDDATPATLLKRLQQVFAAIVVKQIRLMK